MTDFELKDSGQHKQYESGMRRDTQEGKPRFALMVTKAQPYEEQMLTRYANHLAKGAAKYDDRNWEDGDSEVELERAKDSLLRHTMQLLAGERDEDHAAAVWFNTQAVEYFRWRIQQKALDAQEKRLDTTAGRSMLVDVSDWEPLGWISDSHVHVKAGDMVETPETLVAPIRWTMAKADPHVHVARLPKAPDLPNPLGYDMMLNSAKVDFQRAINEWHNRPARQDLISGVERDFTIKPGPPATPEDRIRAKVNLAAARHLASPTEHTLLRRVGEWLERYGIELLEGDMGDTYETIDIVEFDQRLKQGAKIIRKSPVDDQLSFD